MILKPCSFFDHEFSNMNWVDSMLSKLILNFFTVTRGAVMHDEA